ncbi:MAG: cysteine peptidase family C39 domain-containing protein [Candidatus Saccharimonadales bacterium]
MAVLAAGGAEIAIASDRAPPHTEPHWRSGPYCGVNAAYALLRLLDAETSYEKVRLQISVTGAGSNLMDIRDCLARAGFHAAVVKGSPSDLIRTRTPFIAHFERDERQAFAPSDRGHFVVVVAANHRSVRYIDGATATIENQPADNFIRNWSGFMLVPRNGSGDGMFLQRAGLAAMAFGLLSTAWGCRRATARAIGTLVASLCKARFRRCVP